jgi:hypothetical protein
VVSAWIVAALIAVGGGIIFLILFAVAVAGWVKVAAAKRWPVTPGTIVSSEVIEARDSRGGWYTYPRVDYQYVVAGRVYRSNVIAFGERSLKSGTDAAKQKATETVRRYAPGRVVEVRHSPTNPADSALEIRNPSSMYALLGGVIFLFAGVFVAAVVLAVNSR